MIKFYEQNVTGDLLKSRQILSSMLETQPLNQQVSTILKNVQNGKNSFGFENKRAFSKISYYWGKLLSVLTKKCFQQSQRRLNFKY